MFAGQCRLGGHHRELVDSHVWSRFGYKRYASDLAKGGQFVDLGKRQFRNEQYTRKWLCTECEERLGKSEDYAARLLSRLEKQPTVPHQYDERLLRFATSISWRTSLFHLESRLTNQSRQVKASLARWRDYLLCRKSDIRPFSQHLFVIFDRDLGFHKGLGGEVLLDDGFVLSHVGPLFIIGLFGRRGLPVPEIKVWDASELRPEGGTIQAVSEWHVGRGGTITYPLFRRLERRVRLAVKIVMEMHAAGQV